MQEKQAQDVEVGDTIVHDDNEWEVLMVQDVTVQGGEDPRRSISILLEKSDNPNENLSLNKLPEAEIEVVN